MKTKYFFILAAFAIAGVSCQKEAITTPEVPELPLSGNTGYVTGSDANAGLKSTLSTNTTIFTATTDIIGMYSDNAKTLANAALTNASMAAQVTGANTQFGANPSFLWGSLALPHQFWAYFPRTATAPTRTAVPITFSNAQTQAGNNSSAHVGPLDFLVATPISRAAGNQTGVNFAFNHVFCIVKAQVKVAAGRYLGAVRISPPAGNIAWASSTIDITQATPAAGVSYALGTLTTTSTRIDLTLNPRVLGAVGGTIVTCYFVVYPGNYGAGNFTFRGSTYAAATGGAATTTSPTKAAIPLLRGNLYSVDLTATTMN